MAINLIDAREGSIGGVAGFFTRIFLRVLQFVLALTVCGLYGTDLHAAHKVNKYADSKWVYAVVVAGMSAVTCLVYCVPQIKPWFLWVWDATLFILWTAVFGIFGSMYIHENPETIKGHGSGGAIQRMKNAVWVDLVNMLLWFITATYGACVFFWVRRGKTLHTGRARV